MNLVVFSHKLVWKSKESPTGYATDGGFAMHMAAISGLFDKTTIVVPETATPRPKGEVFIDGKNINLHTVKNIDAVDFSRKVRYPLWLLGNIFTFYKLLKKADAVHCPIPSDMGAIPMVMARWMGKKLFVRHCGNWLVQKTAFDRFCKNFMEEHAGGKNVMFATGGAPQPPSAINPDIHWIFSSSLWQKELDALKSNLPVLNQVNPRLIIVSRQEKEKGTDRALEALVILKKKYPGIHLDILGSGGYLNTLKEMSASLGLNENVTFHDKVNHKKVIELMKSSNIFCYPTRAAEGFPKVVLEAMASGLPVITNPVSVLKELMSHNNGILLQKDEPQDVANAVIEIVDNPAKYLEMQKNAQDCVRNYSLENWRDTIGSYLKKAWGNLD